MNHPKAKRLRLFVAVAAVAAFAAFAGTASAATIATQASTVYSPNATPGMHGDYTIIQNFDLGAGFEFPTAHAGTNDMKKWIVDSPAGLIGNPNAIPYEDRCTPAEFEPVGGAGAQFFDENCPASSKVGEATVYLATDAVSGFAPGGSALPAVTGDIFILQTGSPTGPEIPVTLATRLNSAVYQSTGPMTPCAGATAAAPCPVYLRTRSVIAPVTSGTDGDFRLRTVPAEYSSTPDSLASLLPTGDPMNGAPFGPGLTNLHVRRIDQKLFGMAATGKPFITYPTRCDKWNSTTYLTTTEAVDNGTVTGIDTNHPNDVYVKSNTDEFQPTCESKPFPASVDASVNIGQRDSNPSLTVTVKNPIGPGDGDLPKDMTVTLPPTLTTDLQRIAPANICSIADRDAGTCQPSSKVGSVTVKTPFIEAGLSGNVYITKSDNSSLPNLAIYVTGAISFRLDATNSFVGPRGNQIQSKLVNLPQVLFTEFKLTVDGGAQDQGLLTIPPCKEDGSAPEDGPITASTTGWNGGTASSTNATNFNGCYSKPKVSRLSKCVKSKLKVTPRNLLNKPGIAKVELYAGPTKRKMRRLKTDKASPFKFNVKLSNKKFKKGKKAYFRVRTVYKPTVDEPKGKVEVSNTATFKRCR